MKYVCSKNRTLLTQGVDLAYLQTGISGVIFLGGFEFRLLFFGGEGGFW